MASTLQLTVTIQRKDRRLPRFVVVPSKAIAPWALKGTTVIEGSLNGIDLGRRTIKRWDDKRWFIDITENLCRRAQVDCGDRVELILQVASDRLPKELAQLLETDREARVRWEKLTLSQQRLLREHILSGKQPATRERRAARALRR